MESQGNRRSGSGEEKTGEVWPVSLLYSWWEQLGNREDLLTCRWWEKLEGCFTKSKSVQIEQWSHLRACVYGHMKLWQLVHEILLAFNGRWGGKSSLYTACLYCLSIDYIHIPKNIENTETKNKITITYFIDPKIILAIDILYIDNIDHFANIFLKRNRR